jgi:hypothetical protein
LCRVVDLGSGKAYLSQVLSTLYFIPVYAVDSKATNTAGAAGRLTNLGRKWTGLQMRATERAGGAAAPRSRKQRIRDGQQPPAAVPPAVPLTLLTQYIEADSDLGQIIRAEEKNLSGKENEKAGVEIFIFRNPYSLPSVFRTLKVLLRGIQLTLVQRF